MECNRPTCHLTALWQIGFTFTPRWTDELQPAYAWTSLCLCGLCADDVSLADFGDTPEKMAASMTGGHPDAVRVELRLDDISDGYWQDPTRPGRRSPL